MKLMLATIFSGLLLSAAVAQDVGVPGVFEFHGPARAHHRDWDRGRDWDHEGQHRGYWKHRSHRCWDEDEGEWEKC